MVRDLSLYHTVRTEVSARADGVVHSGWLGLSGGGTLTTPDAESSWLPMKGDHGLGVRGNGVRPFAA
jgi:hypothetical protein